MISFSVTPSFMTTGLMCLPFEESHHSLAKVTTPGDGEREDRKSRCSSGDCVGVKTDRDVGPRIPTRCYLPSS